MLLTVVILIFSLVQARWTDEDEAQRIDMIKEMERKAWEDDIRAQQLLKRQQTVTKYAQSPAKTLPKPEPQVMEKLDDTEENWCYHCTSPIKHLSEAMKRTIKDFLKLRRTSYPQEVSTTECVNAKNFTLLHKQKCRHRYCQTMSIVDNEQGASFVLRGCAENFGAIDTKTLDTQRENACTKLHDRVDISECICKERKYCYANEQKSSAERSLWTLISAFFLLIR